MFVLPPVPKEPVVTVPEVEAAETPKSVALLIHEAALKYGVDETKLYRVLNCESAGFTDPKIQSGYYHDGVRETSYGYAQFHLPSSLKTASGDMITYEIAIDPAQAIDAAAFNFSQGNANQWSCK